MGSRAVSRTLRQKRTASSRTPLWTHSTGRASAKAKARAEKEVEEHKDKEVDIQEDKAGKEKGRGPLGPARPRPHGHRLRRQGRMPADHPETPAREKSASATGAKAQGTSSPSAR